MLAQPPMTQLDWLYSTLLAVVLAGDQFIFTRAFRLRSAADPRKAFRWLWFLFLRYMWLVNAAGVALWIYAGRAWGDIALLPPAAAWRIWSSIGLVLIVALLYARDFRKVVRSTRAREKIRKRLWQTGLTAMLPHTRADFRLWVAAAVTAGISEEFIFRGYLIWAFHHWLRWWFSAALSLVVFALALRDAGAPESTPLPVGPT